MSSKIEQAIALAKQEIGRSVYVWGGKGEDLVGMTDAARAAFFEKKETKDSTHSKAENIARCEALYKKRKAAGIRVIRAFDCSGLWSWVFKQIGILKSRLTSRSFYAACAMNTDKTGFSRADLLPGDLVFRHDGKKIVHVAMYIGKNEVLEQTGRDVGTGIRRITAADNRFGRYAPLQEKEPERKPEEPDTGQAFGNVQVKGGSVYVRDANSKAGKALLIARRGQKYPLLRIDPDTGWYMIDLGNGRTGFISNRADLTEVITNA